MTTAKITVICRGSNDWVVAEENSGREFGHYPTAAEAEGVGFKLARKRGTELVLLREDGKKVRRKSPTGWFSRLFRR